MADALGPDEWASVATALEHDPLALGRFAIAFRAGRDAARDVACGCNLAHLRRRLNQGELCAALHLAPEEARRPPFATLTRRGIGFVNVTHAFDLHAALPVLLTNLGGWGALAQRLELRAAKLARKNDLATRRNAAAVKRRDALDAWVTANAPVGVGIDSVAAWEASLDARDASLRVLWLARLDQHTILHAYLGAEQLKPKVSLREAQQALDALEEAFEGARVRKQYVLAALRELGVDELDRDLAVAHQYDSCGWNTGSLAYADVAARIKRDADARRKSIADAKARQERQTELQRAFKKRKLSWCAYDTTWTALKIQYVSDGRTREGLCHAKDVADACALLTSRTAWLASELAAVGVERAQWATTCAIYDRSGLLDGKRVHAREVAAALQEKAKAMRAAEEERAARRVADREARAAHEAALAQARARLGASSVGTGIHVASPDRRCTHTVGGRRCTNPHRVSDPAMGPDGPVCGACARLL